MLTWRPISLVLIGTSLLAWLVTPGVQAQPTAAVSDLAVAGMARLDGSLDSVFLVAYQRSADVRVVVNRCRALDLGACTMTDHAVPMGDLREGSMPGSRELSTVLAGIGPVELSFDGIGGAPVVACADRGSRSAFQIASSSTDMASHAEVSGEFAGRVWRSTGCSGYASPGAVNFVLG